MNKLREENKRLIDLLATSLDYLRWASGAFTEAGYAPIWQKLGAPLVAQLEAMGLNGKGCMSHGVSLGVFSKPVLVGATPKRKPHACKRLT